MHKITKHAMPPEEAIAPTPCATDPELYFPDEQKPNAYAMAACWNCYFQRSCARRALAEPQPEHGIWGGYRLAPGPGLERSRRQLAIVAGYEWGPACPPSPELTAALLDAADRESTGGSSTDTRRWPEPRRDDIAVDPNSWDGPPVDLDTDSRGQTMLPVPAAPAAKSRRSAATARGGATVISRRIGVAAPDLQIRLPLDSADADPAAAALQAS